MFFRATERDEKGGGEKTNTKNKQRNPIKISQRAEDDPVHMRKANAAFMDLNSDKNRCIC